MSTPSQNEVMYLKLFNGWQLHTKERSSIEPDYEKGRALLAYLAIENRWHSREKLGDLFWPNSFSSRANLRQVLSNLRAVLNDNSTDTPYFLVKRDIISFNTEGPLQLDVAEFSAATPSCAADPALLHCGTCLAQMEYMAGLYRGEFMAGFSLPDCSDFEAWLQIQRETMHRRALALLEQLSNCHEKVGDYRKALQFALRYIELEPWNETTHCRVMRLYVLNGQHSAAITQYENCCQLLKNELGVLPNEQTQQLAESIRNGELRYVLPDTGEVLSLQTILQTPAELRQVTVLYCDLFIAGIDDIDESLALLSKPQTRCVEIIQQFSGYVVQAHGGGLLVYFGYPQAHEKAAHHAIQAALAITHESTYSVEVRASVHTGLILTGGESSLLDVVGNTSKLAIQLCHNIAPNDVAISQETHGIVAGYFDCISQGIQSLHGFIRPIEIFKVLQESGARTRLEAAVQLTQLVGRQAEISQLMSLWKEVAQGMCNVVLVQGEAGIGKSRLLHAMKERLIDQPHIVCELRCFPEFSQSPFHPIITMLEVAFGFAHEDTPEMKFDKLVQFLELHYSSSAQEAISLLSQLLSLPLNDNYPAPDFSPQKLKEQTFAILLELLQVQATQQPILLIVEDLHWIDPSTLELLALLVEQISNGSILTLLTARPEFSLPWHKVHATLKLAPLAEHEVTAMITSLSDDMPAEIIRRIVERADGVPLFAEEMAKIATPSNQTRTAISIPATLHDLLATRMDSVGEAKYTAQLAATLGGREFNLDILRKIFPHSPVMLERNLKTLQDAGLVLTVRKSVYEFKHALIQEAAYNSQTKVSRQVSHQRIAEILITDFPDVVEFQPEVIAMHLNLGGESRTAIEYWLKASQRASLHAANAETVGFLDAGLQAIGNIPNDIETNRLEFALQVRLGFALQATQGYGATAPTQAFYKAIALSKKIGNTSVIFQALLGLAAGISSHPNFDNTAGLDIAHQLLSVAKESGEPQMLQQAYYALGAAQFWIGDFAASRHYHEQSIALDPLDQLGVKADDSDRITSVVSQAFLSWVLWFQGFPDQAQEVSQLSIKRARHFSHPNTLAFTLTFASALHRWLGNKEASLSLAEEGILLAQKMNFPVWLVTNIMQQGWGMSKQGKVEGVDQIRQCVDNMRVAMGGVIITFSAPLAEALLDNEQAAEALSITTEALNEGKKKNDHHFEAELYRLKGLCLMALLQYDNAELCFRRALEVSRRQSAKSLELRVSISLAQLWQQQDKSEDAQHMLRDIYYWFTEGFDTSELQEAANLLRTLQMTAC